ncbi:hypothetical protein ABIE62_002630 [Porphyrobacter sp. MBR-155]
MQVCAPAQAGVSSNLAMRGRYEIPAFAGTR